MSLECQRLEEQIKLIESQLKQLPEGKLICKRNETRYKWYCNKDGKQIYIPKKERKLAETLAAKKYLEHLLVKNSYLYLIKENSIRLDIRIDQITEILLLVSTLMKKQKFLIQI